MGFANVRAGTRLPLSPQRYKFIPPRMIKGCQKFLDLNDGKFEHLLFGADLVRARVARRSVKTAVARRQLQLL